MPGGACSRNDRIRSARTPEALERELSGGALTAVNAITAVHVYGVHAQAWVRTPPEDVIPTPVTHFHSSSLRRRECSSGILEMFASCKALSYTPPSLCLGSGGTGRPTEKSGGRIPRGEGFATKKALRRKRQTTPAADFPTHSGEATVHRNKGKRLNRWGESPTKL